MRRLTVVMLAALGLLLSVSGVQAQFTGQLSTASTLHVGQYDLGGYFGVYEDAFAFFGQFRSGVAQDFDMGLKLGVINEAASTHFPGDNTGVLLAGDFKYQLLRAMAKDPFDLSIGLGLEFSAVSHYNIFSVGANFIGSYDFDLSGGRTISPYARLNLRGQREHYHEEFLIGEVSATDNDFKVGLNAGASLKVSSNLQILGELQFDEVFGFIGGVTYSF
ncbi:MAG TPA: hypothetical protein VMT04_08860 [Terriglobales bacterium]|nr:hypothetical protein [Terriglobales bacterium]